MRIYSTLAGGRETFVPREDGKVSMYVCGATVQSLPHLGHGRYVVVFDVVRRYFEFLGYDVMYVRNVTDVDDKIIAAADARGVTTDVVAEEAAVAFATAYDALGVLPVDVEPKATEHIPQMIEMIERLMERGHAYQVEGDVYFRVRSFEGYGKLSGRDINELMAGARVAVDELKLDPLDFALWKAAKKGEPGWSSPWGEGRPGWHIECSAMSHTYLGSGFDIHGGGNDLVFPHHENEIAQAEAALGQAPFARYWMHNGMLTLSGDKMSKSSGHVVDLLGAVDKYPGLAVRLFYLRTHYRKPLDFSEEALADATASLKRMWEFRRRARGPIEADADQSVMSGFRSAVDNDFDVAGGLGVLFDAVRDANRRLDGGGSVDGVFAAYDAIMSVLGLVEPVSDLMDIAPGLVRVATQFELDARGPVQIVEALLARRDESRVQEDWSTGDAIRDALEATGIVVKDGVDGSSWHRR